MRSAGKWKKKIQCDTGKSTKVSMGCSLNIFIGKMSISGFLLLNHGQKIGKKCLDLLRNQKIKSEENFKTKNRDESRKK